MPSAVFCPCCLSWLQKRYKERVICQPWAASVGSPPPPRLHPPPTRAESPRCGFVLSLLSFPASLSLLGRQTLRWHKAGWGVEDSGSCRLTGSLVSPVVNVRKGVFVIFSHWEWDQPVALWRNQAQHFTPGIDHAEHFTVDFRAPLTTRLMGRREARPKGLRNPILEACSKSVTHILTHPPHL